MTVLDLLKVQESDPAVVEAREALNYYLERSRFKGQDPDELELRLRLDTLDAAVDSFHRKALADEFLVDCD